MIYSTVAELKSLQPMIKICDLFNKAYHSYSSIISMWVVEALVSTLGWKAKPPTRKQTKLNYPCILGEFLYFRGEA